MLRRCVVPLVLVGLVGGLAFAQAPVGKLGVVDAEVVIRGSVEGKRLLEQLNKFQGSKQVEMDAKTKEISDLRTKLQTQALTLSEEARAKLEKDIDLKTTSLRRIQEDAQTELDNMKEEGLRNINLKVLPVIEKFAKDNGYSLIFDKNRSGIIVSDGALDVSPEIIKLLDAEKAAPPATPGSSK